MPITAPEEANDPVLLDFTAEPLLVRLIRSWHKSLLSTDRLIDKDRRGRLPQGFAIDQFGMALSSQYPVNRVNHRSSG